MDETTDVPVQLLDPTVFARRDDYVMYRWLRQHDPVHWHEPSGEHDRGFWAVTRHEDVVHVTRSADVYSSAQGTQIPDRVAEGHLRSIHNMDAPKHTALRRVLLPAFTPAAINELDARVGAIIKAAIAEVAGAGECDFVSSVSAQFPLVVLGELLGVPASDRPLMLKWTHRLATEDPDYHPTPQARDEARTELFEYIHELSAERRRHPRQDLISTLVTADVDGEPMSQDDIDAYFVLLVVAGNETTRHATSIAAHALLENEAQRRLLTDGLVPVRRAVEEMVRWATPVIQMRRTALEDVTLHGRRIRAGDKVVVYFASANRDEQVFDEPERFDIERWPNHHLAFGSGPHFCLGAHLARLELTMVFEHLLPFLGGLELTAEPDPLRSIMIRGIKRMPVEFSRNVVMAN